MFFKITTSIVFLCLFLFFPCTLILMGQGSINEDTAVDLISGTGILFCLAFLVGALSMIWED